MKTISASLLFVSALLPQVGLAESTAMNPLLNATIFKMGHVGVAAHTSEEEAALVTVLTQPNARAELRKLLQASKSNEAKLYALCGIRRLSRPLFVAEVKRVRWDGKTFNHMRADVITKASTQDRLRLMRSEGCFASTPTS